MAVKKVYREQKTGGHKIRRVLRININKKPIFTVNIPENQREKEKGNKRLQRTLFFRCDYFFPTHIIIWDY